MSTNTTELKKNWLGLYQVAKPRLSKVPQTGGVISAFNSNIDAVIKIKGSYVEKMVKELGLKKDNLLKSAATTIVTTEDLFRGFIRCFKNGIAEEWLVSDVETFHWMEKNVGYDKLQIGGQGGIIANTAAVCGSNPVFVHCASLPKAQAELYLDLDNLLSFDSEGKAAKACKINRKEDALIHWILEFDIGDTITIDGETIKCPKSNRFIATYDPLNFRLHIDENFQKGIKESKEKLGFILLSGYQMLTKNIAGGISGTERIDESVKIVKEWKKKYPESILHFEFASTQDADVRKYLVDHLANISDSIGCNERETIDILQVIGETELAKLCDQKTDSINLFQAIKKIFDFTGCDRIQLHMFGLYVTISKKNAAISPADNRDGMIMAATIAAAKAGTGSIYAKENLMWAYGREVADIALRELEELSVYLAKTYGANDLTGTGVWEGKDFDVIAVPTILIDKPITLVGMGDTISSLSLIGAKAK